MSLLSLSRAGLQPLRLSLSRQPVSRFTTTASVRSATMSTTAIVAAAAVAVGAYALYARSNSAQAAAPGGKPAFGGVGSYNTLQLTSSEPVTDNVKRLRFALADPQTKTGLTYTSPLLALTFPGGGWLPTPRPYTPVSDLNEPGHIEFLVKQYPGGKGSTYLSGLQPGDTLTFVRIPGYAWVANEQPHIGLIAGGQGITPCFQLLRGILTNPDDRTRITLVWGVNRDSDLFLKDELAALEKAYPDRLKTVYVVSHPAAGSAYTPGHVTETVLQKVGIAAAEKGAGVGKVFLSGPPPMEKALADKNGVLAQLGFGKKQVHTF